MLLNLMIIFIAERKKFPSTSLLYLGQQVHNHKITFTIKRKEICFNNKKTTQHAIKTVPLPPQPTWSNKKFTHTSIFNYPFRYSPCCSTFSWIVCTALVGRFDPNEDKSIWYLVRTRGRRSWRARAHVI